ncbi:hypothetical protein SAMN05414139_10822 [Burkholderia sp. D7]|nr:hypothetical protein SAMN05414139_10822 [Burkholderia sp. D7]
MRNAADTVQLAFLSDSNVEIRLDSLEIFVNGRKGRFPGRRVRDFVVHVARHWPDVACFKQLTAVTSIGDDANFAKLAYHAKTALAAAGLSIELLRSVRGEGYGLVDGWTVVHEIVNPRQLAESYVAELRTALDQAQRHVSSANLETNAAGLMYVVRSHAVRDIASRNYALFEDAGWQLIYLLSEPTKDLLRGQRLVALKMKIESLASYALLWRLGDGNLMNARDWRSDFATESEALFSTVERMVYAMIEGREP